MVNIPRLFSYLFMPICLSACLSSQAKEENMAFYEGELAKFEQTQSVKAICNAAAIIGNRQEPISISKQERKALFIKHIFAGLDEAHKQGISGQDTRCSSLIETNLYVLKTAIINQSREMVTCLDDDRINGLYTREAYDACAKTHNYTP